ncbi:MAG TPA: hypothetical protein DDW23_03020 [Planctomycetes bacterium]|nr:hypothetical protein [Planctomycetota bacterium]
MSKVPISYSLNRLKWRIRAVLAAFGCGRLLTLGSVGVATIYTTERLLAPPYLVRWLISVAIGLIVLRVGWKQLILPLASPLTPNQLALWWEREHPELRGRLSCLIELQTNPRFASVDFLHEIKNQIQEILPTLNRAQAIPSGKAQRSLAGGILLTICLIGLGLAFPHEKNAFLRQLSGEEVAWPGSTELVLLPIWIEGEDAPRIPEELAPGEHRLRIPIDTRMNLRVRAQGRQPQLVQLHNEGSAKPMHNLGGGEFSFSTNPLSENTLFTFKGGDDKDGKPNLQIILGETPPLENWTVQLTPPAYTRLEGSTSTMHEFRIPLGTQITANFTFPTEPKAVTINTEKGEITPTLKNGRWSFSFNATENSRARIAVTAIDGFVDSEAASLRWWVEPDKAPRVSIQLPATRWTTVPGGKIPLLLDVEDDYGLAGITLLPSPIGPGVDLPNNQKIFRALPVPPSNAEETPPPPFHLEIHARDQALSPGLTSALSPRIEIVGTTAMEERLARKMAQTREELEAALSLVARPPESGHGPKRVRRKMERILEALEETLLERVFSGLDPGTEFWQQEFSQAFLLSGALPRGSLAALLMGKRGAPLLERAGLLADITRAGHQTVEGPARYWEEATQNNLDTKPIRQELEIQIRSMLEILTAWEDFQSAVNLLRNLLDRQRAIHFRTREASEG